MRLVRIETSTAILLGLTTTQRCNAFIPPATTVGQASKAYVLVPAAKYHAAVSGSARRPSLRHMRLMATSVEEAVEETVAKATSAVKQATEAVSGAVSEGLHAAEHAVSEAVSGESSPSQDSDSELPASAFETPEEPKTPVSDLVAGQEYEGRVNNVVSYGCFVDIGAEVNGLVHISQLADDFVASVESVVQVGDTVKVKVLSVELDAKKVVLSMRNNAKKSQNQKESADVSKYAQMLADDPEQLIPGTIENIVSYGAFVKLEEGVSGFLHISQLNSNEHVENPSAVLNVGQEVQIRIRDVDADLGRVNLSLLPLKQTTSRDVSKLVGMDKETPITGTVSSIQDYGVFVTIEGVDGLVHVSKIQDRAKTSPEEMREKFTPGQEVQVYILAVSEEEGKLSLTMVPPKSKADLSQFQDLPAGTLLDGTVVSTTTYGAFVRLPGGIDGMVHISEICDERIENVTDKLNVGDEVKVRVIEVVPEQRRVRLSMRAEGSERKSAAGGEEGRTGGRQRRAQKGPRDVSKYASASPEEWLEGKVASITAFGAFVSLDGNVNALLHISRISEDRVESVEDVLTVGQQVRVRVVEIDEENGRIGVSMRQPGDSDSSAADTPRESRGRGNRSKRDVSALVGQDPNAFIPGKVVSLLSYGCFVSLDGFNVQGLLHISQISEDRIETVDEVVKEGQEVQVRVVEVNTEANNLTLSMLDPSSAKAEVARSADNSEEGGEDNYGGEQRKRSPRPRFNDIAEVSNKERTYSKISEESDWANYMDTYLSKRK